jgi:hypothetical protein
MLTIQESLVGFLDAERERAPDSFEETDLAIENLISFLESYGHQYVEDDGPEFGEPDDEFSDPDDEFETTFIDANGPDILPATVNEFLFFWQIRKFGGDADDARATGLAIQRLMEWLAQKDLANATAAEEAATLARMAADEVSLSKELEDLLGPLTRMAPAARPSDVDQVVEDFQRITRVEPGQLWLAEDVGPIAVATEASEAARVGWWMNVVVERREGTWYLTELGGVYPRLDEEESDDTDWDDGGSFPA